MNMVTVATSQFSSFLLIFSLFPICFGFSGVASFSIISNWPTWRDIMMEGYKPRVPIRWFDTYKETLRGFPLRAKLILLVLLQPFWKAGIVIAILNYFCALKTLLNDKNQPGSDSLCGFPSFLLFKAAFLQKLVMDETLYRKKHKNISHIGVKFEFW